MQKIDRVLIAAALGITLVVAGCANDPVAETAAAPAPETPTATEAPTPPPTALAEAGESGARAGLNERFLADDLDVERMAEVFEGESREIYASRMALLEALALAPGTSVADIGAGTGLFEPLFSQAVGPEGRVFAVDISPRFVEHLRDRVAREGLDNVEVLLGGDRTTRLSPGSVDTIFVCDTYHHFEYPAAMLADLHAALRPGGQLVIIDFERVPGESPDWILDHVRAGKPDFRDEIESAGFTFREEVEVPGIVENYVLRFDRP